MSMIPSSSSFLQVADAHPPPQQQQQQQQNFQQHPQQQHQQHQQYPQQSQQPQQPQQPQQQGGGTKVRVVAGYALQQKLGSGSFAVVYKGVRLPPQQQQQQQQSSSSDSSSNDDNNNAAAPIVAIKAIARTSEKLTKKVLLNLEMEINILRTYRHRNIVCMHDVQKTERHFYLLLEFCGGGDVQRLIRTRRAGRLTEGLTRRLMRDLSAGLKFLWAQELIHRDIKPQNLLLTGPLPLDEVYDPEKTPELEHKRQQANFPSADFCLKIADFGFARHLQSASLAETLCGSPLYMAPEILQHQRYDAKADLWSVGTVLYEMITGKPPFNGENHFDLLRNIQKKAVRLPQNVRVSKECVNLLRLLLNRQPLTRAGFKEFFEACDAFVALGCQGVWSADEGNIRVVAPQQKTAVTTTTTDGLGTIPENHQDGPAATPYNNNNADDSLLTVATHAPISQPQVQQQQTIFTRAVPAISSSPSPGMVTPPFGPISSPVASAPPLAALPPMVVGGSAAAVAAGSGAVQQQLQQQNGALARTTATRNPQHQHPQYHNFLGQQYHQQQNIVLAPLVPSPPTSTACSPVYGAQIASLAPPNLNPLTTTSSAAAAAASRQAQQLAAGSLTGSRRSSDLQLSSGENSFVMVDPPSSQQRSPTGSGTVTTPTSSEHYALGRPQQHHPSSPGYYISKGALIPPPNTTAATPVGRSNEYMLVKPQQKGMLSTSPGTGGALMGMLSGRARLLYAGQQQPQPPLQQQQQQQQSNELTKQAFESKMKSLTKMLAASEDVGRRAISVAHLGDNRAYIAMRLKMMNEGSSSSLLSVTPMEGIIEEEPGEHDSGTVTDDSGSTEIMASVRRRRRSSSATDKSMSDAAKEQDEIEDLPFALHSESSVPVVPAGMPSRASASFGCSKAGTSITQAQRHTPVKPTPAMIRSHFSEALSCYLKALKMLKGSVGAAQRVVKELEESLKSNTQRTNEDEQQQQQRQELEKLLKRCEVTSQWLGEQFHGVLERADATNGEIAKIPTTTTTGTHTQALATTTGGTSDRPSESVVPTSVEELVYNHSLAHGREGAVKQLLGQNAAARASYRSAGLLAETLLMEPSLGAEDRKILEDYVDGFAERITELDSTMLQQQQQEQQQQSSRLVVSTTASSSASRRSMMPAVVSLVGQPAAAPAAAFALPTTGSSSPSTLQSLGLQQQPRFS